MGVKATVTFENAVQNAALGAVPHRSTRTSWRYGFRYQTTAMASAVVTATPTRNRATGLIARLPCPRSTVFGLARASARPTATRLLEDFEARRTARWWSRRTRAARAAAPA